MRRTSFSTKIIETHTTTGLLVRGELDLLTAPDLDAALASCLERGHTSIGVDMHDVTFMACAGLNVLLDRRHRAWATGVRVDVLRPSAAVTRLVRLARVPGLLLPACPAT